MRTSTCLRVPRMYGEKTIAFAVKYAMIDRSLEIQKDSDTVFVPILQHPSKEETEALRQTVPLFEVLECTFREKAKTVSTYVDFLAERLPPHLLASLPKAFDIIGDIAVIEIPQELADHVSSIGEAVMSANKNVRTVLEKKSSVNGMYRLREFGFVAGEPKTTTIHREYGCQFYVDLAKVYFSPRLSTEHHRLATLVRKGETVVDLFAGIGPFSIQIAKNVENATVYAVDLNPDAIELLKQNIRLNRVEEKVYAINGDARQVVQERLSGVADRVIMNLPEKAIDFVDAACCALKPSGGIVHFYTFANATEKLGVAQSRFGYSVEKSGRTMERVLFSRLVRATAPHEWQIALDIKIR